MFSLVFWENAKSIGIYVFFQMKYRDVTLWLEF